MKTIKIDQFSNINAFVNDMSTFESDIDVFHGRYVVDAKSPLGVLSLNLSNPISVVIHSENPEEIKRFDEVISKYEVK